VWEITQYTDVVHCRFTTHKIHHFVTPIGFYINCYMTQLSFIIFMETIFDLEMSLSGCYTA